MPNTPPGGDALNIQTAYAESFGSEGEDTYEIVWPAAYQDEIEIGDALSAIGAAPDEQLQRISQTTDENFEIVMGWNFEDETSQEASAVEYDPTNSAAVVNLLEENLDQLIILTEQQSTNTANEDPTLELNDIVGNEATPDMEQATPAELTRGQKLAGLARTISKEAAPVVIGMGTKMAVKGAAAGVIGGPALAGLAGGVATGVRVGTTLKFEGTDVLNPEELGESSVAKIHERYVMKQKRRAEKGGKINRALTLLNAPEKWAVEKTFKTEDREKMIDEQLLALGIGIKTDEQGRAYIETTEGRKVSEILSQADVLTDETEEKTQLDLLIQRMAVQGRLAGFSSSTMEGMRDVKKDLFLQACAIKGENSPELLEAALEAAKAEFGAKEKLATTGMLAGISTAKSAFKGAIGVGLAESIIGENIEESIERGIEFVGDKFEYASEALKDATEQLTTHLERFREYGAQLVNSLKQREEARRGLDQVVKLTNEIQAIKGVQETLGEARLVAETVRSFDIETLSVEVPSGSTVGQELMNSLQNNGEGIDIWNESSAEVWGAMIFENQEDGFFLDAMAMAKSVDDEQWMQFANELGFDETTGQFDREAVLNLVEKAKGGDRAAFQKLYRMFHWVRAGDQINVPTNIHSLLENGLSQVSAQEITTEAVGLTETIEHPVNSITSLVEENVSTSIPMTEAALEAEVMGETLAEADAKTQELMESIKAITGAEDPVADMLNRVETLGDRIGELEELIGPVAEQIEELTDKIEDTYQEIGGIETLANAYYRVRGIIENEPEYLEKLSVLEGSAGSIEVPEENLSEEALKAFKEEPLTYLGLAVAGGWMFGGKKRWRGNRNKKRTQATSPRTQAATASPVETPAIQPEVLTNLDDNINVGTPIEVPTNTPQATQAGSTQRPTYIPGQLDAYTTSTLGPEYDVEFTYGDEPTNKQEIRNTTLAGLPTEQDITKLKQTELEQIPISEKQPKEESFDNTNESDLAEEQLKRQRKAEQQRLADEAIMAAYKEREKLLEEYRNEGVIPFYREVIDFKTVDVEGVSTRKVPVPKVELIGTSADINMEDIRAKITGEVKQEIIDRLQREDPEFDAQNGSARIEELLNNEQNRKAIKARLERIVSSDFNMTQAEALKYPREKEGRDLLLNYIKVNLK